jgi:excinuclease ABC subunit A
VPELIVPDPEKSVREGAIKPWRIGGKNLIIKHNALLKQLAEQLPFDPDVPWQKLPDETRRLILRGAGDRQFAFKLKRMREARAMPFPGVFADLEESFRHTDSDGFRARLTTYMVSGECPECHGTRLNARSGCVRIASPGARPSPAAGLEKRPGTAALPGENAAGGITFPDFMRLDLAAAHAFARDLVAAHGENPALKDVVSGVEQRLHFLLETGLGYLTLERDYGTLSGGEAQRVRLATQLGMGLIGVIYVLDEPSIGLHPHDNQKLLETIVALRDRGNTVIVVEHDEDTMRLADELIELGPEAGVEGGQILFQGTPAACMKLPAKVSRTGAYLARKLAVTREAKPKTPDGAFLTVREARANNLRGIDAKFPVGLLTCVTGVSGSGKSTLVLDILAAHAARKLNGAKSIPAPHRHIENLDFFEKLVQVDQEPIGRSPRSNPASYVDLLPSVARPVRAGAAGQGAGLQGEPVLVQCARRTLRALPGRRRDQARHAVHARRLRALPELRRPAVQPGDARGAFHGKSIADVLELTVREAIKLFRNIPRVIDKLETLDAVGLGYLTLGQSATTLSGGEAQRIKLSLELSKRQQGSTLYILDEPTTGLHWTDIQKLMDLLFKLRDAGNTVIVIEHNLDVINLADWIIDLGPGGGREGGELIFAGTRADLEAAPRSLTGAALRRWRAAGVSVRL